MSFTVSAAEFGLTAEKVAKLNKRAAKAGIPAVATLVELSREVRIETTDYGFERSYTVVEAEITGTSDVRFGGWTLAAVIDHDVAGNITRTVPGFEVPIPAEFRSSSASRCDHCNAVRNRNETILVWSEAEGFKQVGSDCVKLFLGVSVGSLIAWISELHDAEDDRDNGGGYWGRADYSVTEFLAAAALVTETYGFRPASFEGATTKSIAFNLVALRGASFNKFLKEFPELDHPEAKVIERAKTVGAEALAWIAAETGSSDYILNLKTAAAREGVGRNAGLLASLPNSYKRAMGFLAERAAKAAETLPSAHVGEVGDKVTTNATVAYTNRSEPFSYYGPEQLFVILVGDDGNVFHVNTTVATVVGELLENASRDDKFVVTGTVKKHKVDGKGTAVTVLTRAKATAVEVVAA